MGTSPGSGAMGAVSITAKSSIISCVKGLKWMWLKVMSALVASLSFATAFSAMKVCTAGAWMAMKAAAMIEAITTIRIFNMCRNFFINAPMPAVLLFP